MFKPSFFVVLVFSIFLVSCQSSDDNGVATPDSPDSWNIPESQVISGGPPKDGIPSLFDPEVIPADNATYLGDDNLVIGLVVDGQAIAYPHTILDWHEVVNESFGDKQLTVSYCPLTGTGIVFQGHTGERDLTFGVSGLLFNNNLIMFDRQTDSNWPQMRLQCDQGALRDTRLEVYDAIETSWGTWKTLYPNTVILSTNTGFSRPYGSPGSAYPGYTRLDSPPLFRNAVTFFDDRLPPKQRVHGIIFGERPENFDTKVYLIDNVVDAERLIHDTVAGRDVLVVRAVEQNFIVSFLREVDGMTLSFEMEEGAAFPFTFRDKETGSVWNVMGEAVSGPLQGKRLERTVSYNAYWFAWGAFFQGADIYPG